jgi:putative sigma-54 modulation protein
MMTMNVNIQTVHFDADRKLIDFINQKIQKLAMFSDRIIRVNVFLKLDNVMHNIKDKVAEIRVHIPRHSFFVKSTSKSFEESFDDAVDSMIVQIKKNKERKAA